MFLYGQVGEKLTDLLVGHLGRVLLVLMDDEAFGPIDVGFLCAVRMVLEPYCIAHLVEQLVGSLCRSSVRASGFAQGAAQGYDGDWFCKELR